MSELIKQYREMAASGVQFRGLSILQHAEQIGDLIKQHRVRTLLDYGCGAGDAYRSPHKVYKDWGLPFTAITLYDPAFKRNDQPPSLGSVFDAVICSDVLEHIPEADVPKFIEKLFDHARSFVWASVCCRPAKKTFTDGTNLHITLHPLEWWQEQMQAHAYGTPFTLVETP